MNGGRTPEPEWVDLGLPSGLKWRRWNLGAENPSQAGLYVSWGNTEGHAEGSGYNFDQETYESTPGASIQTTLDLTEDIAHVLLGSARMPTSDEFEELVNNCSVIHTTYNGVRGILLTSNINGQVLFFAACGVYDGTTLSGKNASGFCWSKNVKDSNKSYYMNFDPGQVVAKNDYRVRHCGMQIRPVQDATPGRSVIPPTPEDEPKEEETPAVEERKGKRKH